MIVFLVCLVARRIASAVLSLRCVMDVERRGRCFLSTSHAPLDCPSSNNEWQTSQQDAWVPLVVQSPFPFPSQLASGILTPLSLKRTSKSLASAFPSSVRQVLGRCMLNSSASFFFCQHVPMSAIYMFHRTKRCNELAQGCVVLKSPIWQMTPLSSTHRCSKV